MDVASSVLKVTDILVGEQLRHEISADGETCRLRFDSVEVFIDFNVWQDDGVVITVHSVVQDIDPESPGAAQALNLLNDLNRSYFFVKFVFRDGLLIARRDLLGDTLSPAELDQRAVRGLRRVEPAARRARRPRPLEELPAFKFGPEDRSARTCSSGASRPCPRCPSGGSAPGRRRRSP